MKYLLILLATLMAPTVYAHGEGAHPAASSAAAEQTDWGIAGTAATRTVVVDLLDAMRFSPDRIEAAEGETIRFVIRNRGRMPHEMVVGTPEELTAHGAAMASHPGMEHDAPYMAHVAPGAQGEIVWTFNRAGEFEYACLLPGHHEAGMRGIVVVHPADGASVAPDAAQPASEGEVRRIDAANGRLTLRHGRIDNLDMPPMTMVFRVLRGDMLDGLKVGDRVRFDAERRDGTFTVVRLQRLP